MKIPILLLALALPVAAQDSIVPETPALSPEAGDGPAKEALELFNQGRHADAVEAARPLADKEDPDALFLLGYAAETGQGIAASRDEALRCYRKAAEKGHEEATYRRALILLNSTNKAERETGRKVLEAASETDQGTAGRILGEAWLRGFPDEKADFDKAVKWWTGASEAGDTTSLLLLARLYGGDFGYPEKTDEKKVFEFYQKAAYLGDKAAYLPLGSRLLNGPEEFRDEAKGREWLAKAIDNELPTAWLAIGDFEENIKEDDKAAYLAYMKGAEAEQQGCMLRVAGMLYNGVGVEQDKEAATNWLEKTAKLGNAQAHLELANLASSEEEPDLSEVYGHLVAAADGGIARAQNDLGLLYLSGNLGAADRPAAVAWLTRAAKAGMAAAQNNLGALFERGVGVTANFDNAGELYSLAANQGHPEATTALARMHAVGIGTDPDLPKAWALATLAVERGDEKAKTLLGELSPRLTPELLTEAKKQLETMKASKPAEDDKPEDDDDAAEKP